MFVVIVFIVAFLSAIVIGAQLSNEVDVFL
jgi:hypothetical protein